MSEYKTKADWTNLAYLPTIKCRGIISRTCPEKILWGSLSLKWLGYLSECEVNQYMYEKINPISSTSSL